MKYNSPAVADAQTIAQMGRIGLVSGYDFDASKIGVLDEELVKAVQAALHCRT